MQKLKGSWSLGEAVVTSAGSVAAGSAGDGPDLVLAHGWPWSSFSWHRVIPALAETYRVHWYDMPGYRQSDKRPEKATALDVQRSVFAEMLAHWKLDRPRVVAHDFGGAATLRAHLLHGCDFEKYALMNVVAMRPWGLDFFDHVGRHVEAFTGLPPHIHEAVVEPISGALSSTKSTAKTSRSSSNRGSMKTVAGVFIGNSLKPTSASPRTLNQCSVTSDAR